MEQEKLTQDLIEMIEDLSDTQDPITEDTVIESVLSSESMTNNQETFRLGTLFTLAKNGGDPTKEWPNNWMKGTIKTLVSALVMLLLFISTSAQVQVHLGTGKSDSKQAIVEFGLKY